MLKSLAESGVAGRVKACRESASIISALCWPVGSGDEPPSGDKPMGDNIPPERAMSPKEGVSDAAEELPKAPSSARKLDMSAEECAPSVIPEKDPGAEAGLKRAGSE